MMARFVLLNHQLSNQFFRYELKHNIDLGISKRDSLISIFNNQLLILIIYNYIIIVFIRG